MPMVGLGTAGIADASLQVALEQGYRSLDCASVYGNQAAVGAALTAWVASGAGTRDQLFITSKLWCDDHRPERVRVALEQGYRSLDCASVYGNQAAVGAALTAWVASGAGTRDQLFITSKLGSEDHRPERVSRAACEKTLADLKCQYLDLYLMHWPDAFVPGADNDVFGTVTIDHTVTIAQTWAAMEALVDAGLVRSLGISNFSVKQVWVGACGLQGVQCVAYCPLGGGGYLAVNDLLTHPVVAQVAQLTGRSSAQVLLKWNMQRGVPVIPKASSPAHLQDNVRDIFSWSLTSQQKSDDIVGSHGADILYVPRCGNWTLTDQPGVDLMQAGSQATSHLTQVFVILFGVGERESEGIYSLRAFAEDGLPQETIIVFESDEDASRYAGLLEATMDHCPAVCSIPPEGLRAFCMEHGYRCSVGPCVRAWGVRCDFRLEPRGSLLIPPDFNVGVTDWERSMRLRDGCWAVLESEPELGAAAAGNPGPQVRGQGQQVSWSAGQQRCQLHGL
ncbi:aldo_ket_red domain-containing protein, partial [Haematococcus lacustris]